MSLAEQLVGHMFSWMRQRRRCAELLNSQADKLELLKQKCNAGQAVCNTSAALGSALMIGAGVATACTGGAAAVLTGVGTALYGGGLVVSVGTNLTESFLSSKTMAEAQRAAEQSDATAEEIQRLLQQLRMEVRLANPRAEADELNRLIVTDILRVLAQRRGLLGQINIRVFNNEPQVFVVGHTGAVQLMRPEVVLAVFSVLAFFFLGLSSAQVTDLCADGAGKLCTLFSKAVAERVKEAIKMSGSGSSAAAVTATGFRAALCGGAMAVGGATGLAFTLPDAIRNWRDLVERNHVTDASQSLRAKAEDLLETNRILEDQLRTMSVGMDGLEVQLLERPRPGPGPGPGP